MVDDGQPRPIQTIAVLGAGTMGRGIAQVAAQAGFATRLYDLRAEAVEAALAAISRQFERAVAKGAMVAEAAEAARHRLHPAAQLDAALAGVDLVIEAAPESLPLKLDLFRTLGREAPSEALLASNTSALSITELAAASGRAPRCAGMHFFNPVPQMRLLELVRGLQTSEATLATLRAVGERLGKEVVTVADVPGFATTRLNALLGNEAFRMLEQGVASAADLDRAARLGLNHPMGPFEMVDLVGLDVRLAILEHLHATLGEAFRPTNLQRRLVQAGRLGRKVGHGVFRYDGEGRRLDDA